MLGSQMTCSVIVMNSDSFSLLIILFYFLIFSALSHCILWSSLPKCFYVLDFYVFPIFVLDLC